MGVRTRGGDDLNVRLDVLSEPGRVVVRIHGRLAGAAVPELDRVCRDAGGVLLLDVSYLMGADDAGVVALRRLLGEGAQVTGMSRYLSLLLDRGEPGSPKA